MEQALLELTHKIDTLTAQVAYLTEQAQAAERFNVKFINSVESENAIDSIIRVFLIPRISIQPESPQAAPLPGWAAPSLRLPPARLGRVPGCASRRHFLGLITCLC